LEEKSIVPSDTELYKLSDIQNALQSATGAIPFLGCDNKNGKSILKEVWYYTHSIGAPQDLQFVGVDAKRNSSCSNKNAIVYPKRVAGAEE
jgi:ribonuclease T2